MSRTEQAECRGVLLRETDNAILVAKDLSDEAEEFWFPRSQIGYLKKTARPMGGTDITFTCPEWLVENKQAWGLVP